MSKASLTNPIGIFDAGIGSYDIARKIAAAYPLQDIIYFGDRASFPYGKKTRATLMESIDSAISFLNNFNPAAIVLASNAPSIMVLDEIKPKFSVPIIGVTPPIERALSLSKSGEVGVLGVDALIDSEQMKSFVSQWAQQEGQQDKKIHLLHASDLVELVEGGQFLDDPITTSSRVKQKLDTLPKNIDVFTLSSTHLPWLRDYFKDCCPDKHFIDPADDAVTMIQPHVTEGQGNLHIVASQNEVHTIEGFQSILKTLGVNSPVFSKEEFMREHT